MGQGIHSPAPPPIYINMTFLIKFLWNDPGFIKPKKDYVPIIANNRNEAITIFNKFIGIPFNYPILDVSVYEYEE